MTPVSTQDLQAHIESLIKAARLGMGYARTHMDKGSDLARRHFTQIETAIANAVPVEQSAFKVLLLELHELRARGAAEEA